MARIIDKNTRLIDVDFGPITVNVFRPSGEVQPIAGGATFGGNGTLQLIRSDDGAALFAGSFIQFERVDLSYMTMNNEVMQPVEVSVQRTCATPYGTHENGNNYDILQEFLLVSSRPLNNDDLVGATNPYDFFNEVGLNRGSSSFGGQDAGGLNHEQTIYAERRAYAFSSQTGATKANGELVLYEDPTIVPPVPQGILNSIFGAPQLIELNTWGSLSAITGPNLYCYRVFYVQVQGFDAPEEVFINVGFGGFTTLRIPPVNIAFLCKDPSYTEGEYLTRLANAMNSIPEDGQTS